MVSIARGDRATTSTTLPADSLEAEAFEENDNNKLFPSQSGTL